MHDWDKNLAEQVRRNFKNYASIKIDLSTARDNQAQPIPGDLFYVKKVSSRNVNATVRFNLNTNEEITLKYQTKIKTVFTQFFITNTAQAGETIELIIGINFDVEEVCDLRQAVKPAKVILNAAANTNTIGADQVCDSAVIKSSDKNTGLAWVDFGTAAVQDACIPLDAGESISVKISNLNKINVNFENAVANPNEERVFVAYEL